MIRLLLPPVLLLSACAVAPRPASVDCAHRDVVEGETALVPGLGRFVVVDPKDSIQGTLRRGEPWEPELAEVFAAYAPPGAAVADIGAYNGVHSIRLARLVGPRGHVYAFEPNPPAYRMLAANVCDNDLGARVAAYPVGLSDRAAAGHARRAVEAHNLGGTSVCSGADCGEGAAITLVRVDDDVGRWFPTRVAFAKIDVEGHEAQVLRGAAAWLRRDRPVLLIEMWDEEYRAATGSTESEAETTRLLAELGYRLERKIGRWNYVFVPR